MLGTRRALMASRMTPKGFIARTALIAASVLGATEFARAAIPSSIDTSNYDSPSTKQIDRSEIPTIRLRMNQVKSGITITGTGLRLPGFLSRNPGFYQALRVRWVRVPGQQIQWTIEDRDTGQLLARVRAPSLEVAGGSLRLNLQQMPNRLSLRPGKGTSADVIADLDIESYVRGVLPAEMPGHWPLEALKAQAVAARTYALFRKRARQSVGAPYDLEANVMDQVYRVPLLDESADEHGERMSEAVRETKGMVLVSAQDQTRPLSAYFHSDCGGRTESASHVWIGADNPGTAVDAACPSNPNGRWRAVLTADDIAKRLQRPALGAATGLLASVEAVGQTPSGRVDQLKLSWSDGVNQRISAHDFRMALGHDRIRSTNFLVVRTLSGAFEFSGRGYGHGVGLCQWGAKNLAQSGRDFRQILRHYYPRSILRAL